MKVLNREILVRVLADAALLSASYALALLTRLFVVFYVEKSQDIGLVQDYVDIYLRSLPILLSLGIATFARFGFYTKGRAYASRYKVLVIAQAVTLSFLLFGFLGFLLPQQVNPPRSVILIAWAFALPLVISARLWSDFWKRLAIAEVTTYERPKATPGKNVLVIGGAGYIGSALLPKLLERGYKVRLLDLLLYGKEPIQSVINHPHLEIIQADFRQVDKVVEAMQGMDTVVHLGGLVGDPACAVDENLTIEINLMATRMIAEVAKGFGISKFIFASTCSVYGASDQILDERSSLNPVSLYARSKIASERVLAMLADEKFAVVNLRFGTIYGLSGRTRFDLVVNLLAAKAVVDGKITVFGGDQWRPFVHVDDAALAVLKAIEAPVELVRNQIFNVGSNEQNMTLGQVGELIQRIVPNAELIDSGRDGDRRNYRVDFSKIRKILNFEPRWTVAQGVQQVVEAIRSGAVTDYRNPIYSNVKYLTEEASSEIIKQYYTGWERAFIDSLHNKN